MSYDNKRYYKVLKPQADMKLTFAELWLFSVLVQLRKKKYRKIDHLVRHSGLGWRCVQAAKVKLAAKGLVKVHASGSIKVAALDPAKFRTKVESGRTFYQYVKVYRPSDNHPLTLRQNAVYWCIQSWGRRKWYCSSIATQLGLSVRTVERTVKVLQTYQPQLAHYQDREQPQLQELSPLQRSLRQQQDQLQHDLRQQRSQLEKAMLQDGYSESQLAAVFKLTYDLQLDDDNLEHQFQLALKDKKYGDNSYSLLCWKLKDFATKQAAKFVPPTADEAENMQSVDMLHTTSEEYFGVNDFWGRVKITPKRFMDLMKSRKYPKTLLIEALKKLPWSADSDKWLTLDEFLKGV